MQKAGGLNLETFEKVLQSRIGTSGFMLFGELDYGMWLPFYGVRRKAIRLILGNPLIAITMIRHDIEAALFAPVELLLVDNQGGGCTVVYDVPSALMVVTHNPPLLAAAETLDKKLEALVREAT